MSNNISKASIKSRLVYVFAWMLVSFILLFISYDTHTPVFPQWVGYMLVTGLAFPAGRYIAYALIPRYLYQRKIGQFVYITLLLSAANAILTFLIVGFVYHLITGLVVFVLLIMF